MPIKDYPFTSILSGLARPMLWIKVTNPHTKSGLITLAIIDTGADDCAFPADVAVKLGHNLESVPAKNVNTASGQAKVYSHTTQIDILETLPNGMRGNRVLYTIPDTPIDFVDGCEAFLLGTKNFLSNFILTVNYPHKVFSLSRPRVKKRKKL